MIWWWFCLFRQATIVRRNSVRRSIKSNRYHNNMAMSLILCNGSPGDFLTRWIIEVHWSIHNVDLTILFWKGVNIWRWSYFASYLTVSDTSNSIFYPFKFDKCLTKFWHHCNVTVMKLISTRGERLFIRMLK